MTKQMLLASVMSLVITSVFAGCSNPSNPADRALRAPPPSSDLETTSVGSVQSPGSYIPSPGGRPF